MEFNLEALSFSTVNSTVLRTRRYQPEHVDGEDGDDPTASRTRTVPLKRYGHASQMSKVEIANVPTKTTIICPIASEKSADRIGQAETRTVNTLPKKTR